ncbi:amino acid synthesis family protein [Mesorhizobium sp. 1B3]|uniref:amino acid synthesis family protein n=1 Tax=Mesorhizobium sp. 1B3 TaxID=3243599 RepID=UPI003D997EC9
MKIRKLSTFIEETRGEAGVSADPVLRKVAVVAVVGNPLAGRFQEDLSGLVGSSVAIAQEMVAAAVQAMQPYDIVSYGKAGIAGLSGEQEHAVAMLTSAFGDTVRKGVGGGKGWISSFTKRAAPGSIIDVPLAHKDALYVRSHYDGMTLLLADSPLPDEIAVILATANRGRLNDRVGGLRAGEIRGDDGLY